MTDSDSSPERMNLKVNTNKPEASPDCCAEWRYFIPMFHWSSFTEYPDFLTYPYIVAKEVKWRVFFCPSCGREVKDAIITKERLAELSSMA